MCQCIKMWRQQEKGFRWFINISTFLIAKDFWLHISPKGLMFPVGLPANCSMSVPYHGSPRRALKQWEIIMFLHCRKVCGWQIQRRNPRLAWKPYKTNENGGCAGKSSGGFYQTPGAPHAHLIILPSRPMETLGFKEGAPSNSDTRYQPQRRTVKSSGGTHG